MPPARARVLGRLDEAFAAFERFVSELGPARATTTLLGGWSVCDLAAHFAGCHEGMADALERMARGLPPAAPGQERLSEDEQNDRAVEARRGFTFAETLADLRTAYARCRSAAAALADSHFEPGEPVAGWLAEECEHYEAHLSELRQALRR